MKPPAYLEAIERLLQSGVIPSSGIVHVDVAHDHDCALLNGLVTCTCKPLVTVRKNDVGHGPADPTGTP